MKKLLLTAIIILSSTLLPAQFMRSYNRNIASLQMVANDEPFKPAVITLGSDDEINFSFDELSHTYHRYTYRITHCNADWTQSELDAIDYLDGFNDRPIEDWENSVNTTRLYTNYQFRLPNDDARLKVSGNYKVEVFDDESDSEQPVAMFAFAVLERKVNVAARISGNTDIDTNRSHQQLSFDVHYGNYNIMMPATDIRPVVYQNRRPDNCVSGLKPTYMTGNSLQYVHNEKLIFRGGNEYRRFELTDPYAPGQNVDKVEYSEPCFHAELYADKLRPTHTATRDENGRYFINTLQGYGSSIEADYAAVHFTLDAPYSDDGDYYLCGDFNGNFFTPANRLEYDASARCYRTVQMLKLGLYNYHYLWVPRGSDRGLTARSEGDFYDTENEHTIAFFKKIVHSVQGDCDIFILLVNKT